MAVNSSSATPPCLARAPGKSSGATPDSVAQMVADAESFIPALGFTIVDLLGFSVGGMIAQIIPPIA